MKSGAQETEKAIPRGHVDAQDSHEQLPGARNAEAARYALLRRLGPAIRHNMAGSLQPIAMVASMLERRLQKPELDRQVLGKNAGDLVSLSREAASACVDLMSWFAPKENQTVTLSAGIAECLGLVATDFSFKGYAIVNQTKEVETQIQRSAIRHVFTAALIALTDAAPPPGNLVISVESVDGSPAIVIELKSSKLAQTPAGELTYRKLDWYDVEALALEESVQLTYSAAQVTLQYTASATVAEVARVSSAA